MTTKIKELMNSMVQEEGGEDTVVVEQGQVQKKMHWV